MLVSLATTSLLSIRLDEVISLASQAGFEGLELACTTPHFGRARAEHDFEAVAQMLRDSSLKLVALSIGTNFTDPYGVEEEVEIASAFARVARRVGTDCLVVTAGRPASLKAQPDRWHACTNGLRALVAAASRRGVRVTLAVQRGTLADSVAGVSRLLEQVGQEDISIALDLGHVLAIGGEVKSFLEFFSPRIALVRIQDLVQAKPEAEWVPLGQGQTDFRSIIGLLRDSGYDGTLCLPCRHLVHEVDLQPHVEAEIQALRSLLRSGEPVPAQMDV
jgi:sugar phosphate isomerase/epimerase